MLQERRVDDRIAGIERDRVATGGAADAAPARVQHDLEMVMTMERERRGAEVEGYTVKEGGCGDCGHV